MGTHNCDHGEDASVVCSGYVTARPLQPLLRLPLLVSIILSVLMLVCGALLYQRRRRRQNTSFNFPQGAVRMEELVVSDTYLLMPGEEQAAAKVAPPGDADNKRAQHSL